MNEPMPNPYFTPNSALASANNVQAQVLGKQEAKLQLDVQKMAMRENELNGPQNAVPNMAPAPQQRGMQGLGPVAV